MDGTTLLVESLATPWPFCPLCGERHHREEDCSPEWRVVRIWDSAASSYTGPRYYVDPEEPRQTAGF